jgi:hypothetical protein
VGSGVSRREPDDEDEGTVWVTVAGERSTYWVVVGKEVDRVRYARTTPGFAAGTVEVRLRDLDGQDTEADITYDLTALTEAGDAELDEFGSTFQQEIGSWEGLIRRLVSS